MMLRKILNKLIVRVGIAQVMAVTSPQHQKLINYVERARRKVVNARQRQRLLAMIGEEGKESKKQSHKKPINDSDSDIEDISDGSESEEVQESDHDMEEEEDLEQTDSDLSEED